MDWTMLITFCLYLSSAAAFYLFVAKFAPVEPGTDRCMATQKKPCEIIEMPTLAVEAAKKAA